MALSDFTQYALEGVSINNPTSIDFGADGRLYVTQQNGLIKALEIEKTTDGGYNVVSEEVITLVQSMPNHNDDGSLATEVAGRQVTGVITTTNAEGQVVLYVSSSDSRIAGGSSGDDSGLDTNSGVISRLTLTENGWEKVDIVRGLPRSEENHSINGLQLTEIDGIPSLLVAVGGNTNTGAQGNNFSHTNEYYYSASIIKIDLDKIAEIEAGGAKTYAPPGYQPQSYIFDLPTLDDPTRANDANGADLAESGLAGGDPFGGNDGLNQAIYDPSGTVEIYSSGYRNAYDLVVTKDGKLYTYDNGPNSGWGGLPVNANGEVIVDLNGDGVPDNGPATTQHDVANPSNTGTSKPDQLHLIDPNISDGLGSSYVDGTAYNSDAFFSQGLGYYGGHPNVTRAYGTQAGLYLYDETGQPLTIVDGELVVSTIGPVDLGPMIANWEDIVGTDSVGNEFIDPRQAIYLSPKQNDGNLPFDGSLHSVSSSTNGLTEYTWSGDELQNALLTVSFNGNLTALILDDDGKVVSTQTRGIGGNPLDVTAQGDGEIFPGTIWVATHGSDKIFILDPTAGTGITPDPTDRDQDDVEDTFDPFAADPSNGLDNVINANETLVWEFVSGAPFPNESNDLFDGASGLYNGFDIGFTGIMTDGTGLPESFYNPENLIAGGAPGAFQIKRVEAGNPFDNTQRGAYQFGVTPGADTGVFTISTQMDSFFDEISAISGDAKLLQGLFAGSGDMNNFVYVAAVRQADGTMGIEVAWEFEQPFQPNITGSAFYQIDTLGAAGVSDYITVSLAIDSETGLVTPKWEYTIGGQTFTQDDFAGEIETVQLSGAALDALMGENQLDLKAGGTTPSSLAVGILASNSAGQAVEGNVVAAVNAGGNDYTAIVGGQSVTFLSDKPGGGANAWVTGAYKSFSPTTTFDIAGTELDTLHMSERSQTGTWGYAVPVTEGGLYDIDLYMAEIYFGAPGGAAGGVDKRQFKIKVEGQYVDIPGVTDDIVDLYELVGAAKELILSYEVQESTSDGNSTLDIQFEAVTNQAKLSGFIIREAATTPTFAADWENIIITGEGRDLSADETAPVVTIDILPAPAGDAQFLVTVTFTDTVAMDAATVEEGDLIMTGPSSGELVSFEKIVSADGKTVTATYAFSPGGAGWIDGNYTFTVNSGAVADAAGNGVTQVSASAPYGTVNEEFEKGEFVMAVNFNGVAITTEDGITYQADEDINTDGTAWIGSHKFADGQFGDTAMPITNVAGAMEEQLYKTARYGGKSSEFSYTISNLEPDKEYVLTLKFVETWYLNSTAGKRIFDVIVNNNLVIDNLDLLAQAGMHVAFDKDVLVTADANGVIKILMPASVDNAQIAALALHEAPVPDEEGPTGALSVAAPQSAYEALIVTVVYSDESGIDATSVDVTDILLTGAVASAMQVSFDPVTSTATYTFQPPAGGWAEGTYSVQLAAGTVEDTETNGNEAGTPQAFSLDFPDAPQPGYAPADDLDSDSVVNQSDPDIDGDGLENGDDPFAYDSDDDGHGVTLAGSEAILLNFDTAGTPYQNGFTGVMASSNPAFKTEDTGAGSVANGKLTVATTNGDTGTANTPQNGYQLGIKNASFTVEGLFDNPYFGTGEVPNNYEQLGLQVSLHSDEFVKFVFGSPGANIEFSQNTGTPFKTGFANGHTLADFAKAKLELAVTTEGTVSTATATITLLDANGDAIAGGGPTVIGTMTVNPGLAAALQDGNTAVGAGVTSTHFGGDAFTWSMDYFKVTEGGYEAPPEPDVDDIFAAQTDLVKNDTYSDTANGAAILKILPNIANVQTSNYGSNSFTLENVGDKKIVGLFVDVRSALYADSVFDADGSGGDQVTKDFAFQTDEGTGAILPSTYQHFFFAARDPSSPDPLYSNAYSDSGKGAGGGHRGLLLKFSNDQNGFEIGESVGFSGDMDPNSIAGLLKSSVDNASQPAWDVGGVSGAELIGSHVTVMFSDGTTATGQLMGDGSQAGAQVLLTQDQEGPAPVASIAVNGLDAGETGFYGGELPEVIISGPAGATVRVIMTRGIDPVANTKLLNNGTITVDELVEQRLDAYDFAANNAAEFQTVDIVIPASGSIDISTYFKYNTPPNGNSGVPDFNKLPVGFAAAVVDPENGHVPIGPVSEPIYLKNNGTPVAVDGTGPTPPSYYFMEGNHLKVQVEDVAGGGNPPQGWIFQNDSDGTKQTGFQGSGYYYWKSETGTAVNAPEGAFTTTFYVENAGTFNLRMRSSRDSNSPGDQRNDMWVKVDGNIADVIPAGTKPLVTNSGFAKLVGAGAGWGFATKFDTVADTDPDVTAKLVLSQGYHTITFAGRSEGFHIDFFELYQGTAPAVTEPDSVLISGGGEPNVTPTDINLSGSAVDENVAGIIIGNLSATDANVGDHHIFTIDDGRFEVVGNQLKLQDGISLDFETEPTVEINVTATDAGGLSMSKMFEIAVGDDPSDNNGSASSTFIATINGANGDFEQGSYASSPDLETNKIIGLQFTVPSGIDLDGGALIESAVISWVSDRTHSANATLTFSVENKLNGAAIITGVTNRTYLTEKETWQASDDWTDGQTITAGIDLADQLNDLILSSGLKAGDIITVKVEGTGGTRYIEAAGGGRTGPELAITVSGEPSTFMSGQGQKMVFDSSAVESYESDPVTMEEAASEIAYYLDPDSTILGEETTLIVPEAGGNELFL
ncbi:malectin domain-containing carbohydrate-binding protein [Rhizobium sullae]|uniref:Malectin (Di-glucose binding ER protein) n=1 Tax=Rhizobium sullae TaxID=50338 RepID=A0A4R3PRK3_RHISU|nr:malectin domain-containing carbohydrate-binding protein [Rhizobium sullae]TCU06814.1 malectin (di-glucose binding ER protein) [Rhizobium sullae]